MFYISLISLMTSSTPAKTSRFLNISALIAGRDTRSALGPLLKLSHNAAPGDHTNHLEQNTSTLRCGAATTYLHCRRRLGGESRGTARKTWRPHGGPLRPRLWNCAVGRRSEPRVRPHHRAARPSDRSAPRSLSASGARYNSCVRRPILTKLGAHVGCIRYHMVV